MACTPGCELDWSTPSPTARPPQTFLDAAQLPPRGSFTLANAACGVTVRLLARCMSQQTDVHFPGRGRNGARCLIFDCSTAASRAGGKSIRHSARTRFTGDVISFAAAPARSDTPRDCRAAGTGRADLISECSGVSRLARYNDTAGPCRPARTRSHTSKARRYRRARADTACGFRGLAEARSANESMGGAWTLQALPFDIRFRCSSCFRALDDQQDAAYTEALARAVTHGRESALWADAFATTRRGRAARPAS